MIVLSVGAGVAVLVGCLVVAAGVAAFVWILRNP